ncbi:hypothetical protein [Oryzomicrobium sp.]|uniref:hypothetical protein n=1 Tax=Oryzomicrobium sp. TaxID=1911578 RepID=UPI0025EA4612|nr:hypothetical protein [Oryzomicrobium sp.]MCE1241947.1 hypothetical protein [Oryzomicrobium sp.]
MFGAAHGVAVLVFVLAITGVLPGWLAAIVFAAFGLLLLAWLILIFLPPIARAFFDLWR